MLVIGLILLLVGVLVAATVERTVGVVCAVVGLALVLVALLAGVDLRT
jgi:hypothetical protein